MSYALFLIAPDPGSDIIDRNKWEQFSQTASTLKLTSENSQMLSRGLWQLDLNNDAQHFHQLITAATTAGLEFRYMIASDRFSWVYSSNKQSR